MELQQKEVKIVNLKDMTDSELLIRAMHWSEQTNNFIIILISFISVIWISNQRIWMHITFVWDIHNWIDEFLNTNEVLINASKKLKQRIWKVSVKFYDRQMPTANSNLSNI